MLLLRIAHILKTPSILNTNNCVFKSLSDKIIAYWGLSTAQSIKLRDKNASENDLKSIIRLFGSHVASYYDDALFCKTADKETVYEILKKSEIDPLKPYFIVNYHFWGMTDKVKKFARKNV